MRSALPKLLVGALLVAVSTTARAHLTHVPEKFDPATAKLLVVIHGCLQAAESMALGTGFNRVADANNWVVLYPQVPAQSNAINCWSWWSPANQVASGGQLKFIMDEIQATENRLGLKSPKIYVTGISSGGATAAGLAACFPKKIQAVALHSAPVYASAKSLGEADQVLRDGPTGVPAGPCAPQDFKGGVLILHGEEDKVVNPKHASLALEQFGGGGELLMIDDLPHAWSGFKPTLKTEIPFFSPKGPSATDVMTLFFRKH
ncbi:MAG: hypothetical protein KF767_14680 [Bdellovibrionaceae bacterium]|nr:hypothetical protein [Pseudobdellovibrionaceae bacterium]